MYFDASDDRMEQRELGAKMRCLRFKEQSPPAIQRAERSPPAKGSRGLADNVMILSDISIIIVSLRVKLPGCRGMMRTSFFVEFDRLRIHFYTRCRQPYFARAQTGIILECLRKISAGCATLGDLHHMTAGTSSRRNIICSPRGSNCRSCEP